MKNLFFSYLFRIFVLIKLNKFIMKKLLTILMAVGMLSMFAACGSEKSTETETELEFEQESVDSLQVDEVTVISDEVETTEVSSTPVN